MGLKEGVIWNFVVLLLSFLMYWNPMNLASVFDYKSEAVTRYLGLYITISCIFFWYERSRVRHLSEIHQKNQLLNQEIEDRSKLIVKLQDALQEIKTLSGLLPICSSCKEIRDDKGNWNVIENYIEKHSEAVFSHSICPTCSKKLYPELYENGRNK